MIDSNYHLPISWTHSPGDKIYSNRTWYKLFHHSSPSPTDLTTAAHQIHFQLHIPKFIISVKSSAQKNSRKLHQVEFLFPISRASYPTTSNSHFAKNVFQLPAVPLIRIVTVVGRCRKLPRPSPRKQGSFCHVSQPASMHRRGCEQRSRKILRYCESHKSPDVRCRNFCHPILQSFPEIHLFTFT